MAMFDDCEFLVNHIRNSFITSDETGMCELILESDTNFPLTATSNQEKLFYSLDSDCELSHSPDIVSDMDLTGHRRRSNTAQRLEKLKLDKQKQSKIKHVQWKSASHTVEEYEEHFVRKNLPVTADEFTNKQCQPKSALSLQLEQFDMTSNNPFMEYAKFDGRAGGGSVPTKKIDIYLTMTVPAERSYPMTVVTLSTARIQQLIGLICWQYTMENRQPRLLETDIAAYTLNMVEDDGEVDTDFPPLDSREPVNKFGFNKLALVAKSVSPHSIVKKSKMLVVAVQSADGAVYKLSVNADDTSMRDILSQVLAQRDIDINTGKRYRLERQTAPGVAVDPDLTLSAVNATDFFLVRENSMWPGASTTKDVQVADNVLMCHQYRSYDVQLVHKLRSSTPAQLGVSSDKIELNPTSSAATSSRFSRHSFMFSKLKSLTVSMDDVVACVLQETQPSAGRRVVRITYSAEDNFKHCDLDCDKDVASDIVSQVVGLLSCRTNPAYDSYKLQTQKATKLTRRHTLRS
jgi:hypothetical protein